MDNFDYSNPVKYIIGKGQISTRAMKYFRTVNGLYDIITWQFRHAGIDYIELGGVQLNPRLSLVQEGVDICRKNSIDKMIDALSQLILNETIGRGSDF